MKQPLLTLLCAITLFLSACEDKNLTAQVLESEKQITQLDADLRESKAALSKAEEDLRQLAEENNRLQSVVESQSRFPALQVKIEPVFSELKTLKFEKTPSNSGFSREESTIGIFASVAVTGIDWLDQLLLNQLSEKQPSAQALTMETAKSQFAKQFEDMEKEAKEDQPIALNFSTEMAYLGQRNNIVSFSQFSHAYTGGAHGMYSSRYFNIDIEKKMILTLSDLFTASDQTKLKDILWENYKKVQPKENVEWLNKADFRISEEFILTQSGITFVYPPYELASFANGEVKIHVDYSQLNELLNKDYRPNKVNDGIGLNPIGN